MSERKVCEVLLLSAGYGKRLKPLTDRMPKPLVPVAGKSLIERNLESLVAAGFKKFFINLHHLGAQIPAALGSGDRWGVELVYVQEDVLLDTGGAIRNIECRLSGKRLLVVNSDILVSADFPWTAVLAAHEKSIGEASAAAPVLATLVLRADPHAESFGSIGISEQHQIVRFLHQTLTDAPKESQSLMFTGVSLIERESLSLLPPAGEIFSLTRDGYRTMIREDGNLQAYVYSGYWSDVGTPERLEAASNYLKRAGQFGSDS